MATVLVTDAKQRKSVPIIRSLGRRGLRVIAGDDSRFSMGCHSRYCAQGLVYPSPDETPERFLEWLLGQARRRAFEVLFAIDERTLNVVTRHLEALSSLALAPVVAHPTYLLARDKGKTLALAQELGIPCPRTAVVEAAGQLETIAATWEFPLVIKPRRSSGSRGLVYVSTPEEFPSSYKRVDGAYPQPLVQEFIPPGGDALGVEILMNRQGEPRAAFVHRRLREYPVAGGPSTLRESIWAPDLVELGVKLLKAMGWFGVAMVEFKTDPRDGQPKLMEVNPKFWGSIALPIAAGVDFPYLLYRMATEGDVEPVTGYRVGVRCRWLIPGDLLHFIRNPKRFRLEPSFFQFRDDNLYYDLLDWDDLGPLGGMACAALASLGKPGFWRKNLSGTRSP